MSNAPTFERSKTIKLSTIFVVSLYLLVALSSVMLMLSEGFKQGYPPQTFTLFLVLIAFVVVDRWKIWSLPGWSAGILGLIAMAVSFSGILQTVRFKNGMLVMGEENFLNLIFAGAHFLVYLTWIVLFLKKTNQQYWWLWALCVLQIAVGASQSTESMYGVLLSGYLFLAVWTLSVFSLLQGQQQFDRAEQTAKSKQAPGSTSDSSQQESPTDTPAGEKRSEEAVGHPLLAVWRRPSHAVGNVQRDPNASWINPRFLGGVLGTAGLAFVMALLFFLLIPRHPAIWRQTQALNPDGSPNQSRVGFSREMSLGDIGQILESTRKVMDVKLIDVDTGLPIDIEEYASRMGLEEPLFRGMTTYLYDQGQWRTWEATNPLNGGGQRLPTFGVGRSGFVKQKIRLEGIDPELLFAMPQAVYGEMGKSPEAIRIEVLNDILSRPESQMNNQAVEYAIYTPKLTQAVKRPVLPLRENSSQNPRHLRYFYLNVPRELRRLSKIAVRESGGLDSPRPSPLEMAKRLEAYLKTSGKFGYTLNANVMDRNIDPLEDFLINRQVGHCEYFASALTLMLRVVGIPSRLVSGFKGGTYNQITKAYEVEERHAHAWVEAYIEGEGWLILDPTPAGRSESVDSLGSKPGRWNDFRNIMRDFWTRFVVQLNVTEQRRLLEPFKQLFRDVLEALRSGGGGFGGFLSGLKKQLQSPRRWISWQGGLVTFVLLTLLLGLGWIIRAVWRLFSRLKAQYFDPTGLARTVAFYERFRRICEAAGLKKQPSQTPKEYAQEVAQQFQAQLQTPEWARFPISLISTYYDVRYGGEQLPSKALEGLDRQLTTFESLITRPV